jgi:Mn2+/Fe2+ NRAMP family transporter
MDKEKLSRFRKTFGPGIMMAGAAIGVSHLVQSTRAGADYGFSLWWVLLLACASKYPFLEFGPRYTAATGESLLDGYKRLKLGAFPVFSLLTIGTMFIILASVTLVTAGLAEHLFAQNISQFAWSIIILIACILLTGIGHYPAVDKLMKIIMVILLLLTISAVIFVLNTTAPKQALSISPPSFLTAAGISFIIAFMGWMPIPLDSSVWQSIWAIEKTKETGYRPTVKEAIIDYKIGFYGAGIVGIFFFLLGIFVMFGKGNSFPQGSVAFSSVLVDMYGHALGKWSMPFISIAAFAAMFSTTLAVVDIYPRVMMEIAKTHTRFEKGIELEPKTSKKIYWTFMFLLPAVAILIIRSINTGFTHLIDFAASLSFLSAPIIAYYNLKLMESRFLPDTARPSKHYRAASWFFIIFLLAFSLVYIYWRYLN